MDPAVTPNLNGRMYTLIVPPGIDKTKPAPLVLMLHGYTDAGQTSAPWTDMDTYMKVSPETMKRGWILALGHGNLDPVLNHWFWNGTDACCDFEGAKPDDVGYLMGIIEDVEKTYAVDDKRIYAFGHSNGGFMINRLACDQADKFAAFVSLAGETYLDQTKCAASAPIAYLQVQGDADMTVAVRRRPPREHRLRPPRARRRRDHPGLGQEEPLRSGRRHLAADDPAHDHLDGARHHQDRLQQELPGQRLGRAVDHPPRAPLAAVHARVGAGRARLHAGPPETLRRTA